jgi:2-polyprenyl-3-methyl-5-hydroxy-6-metoxy-1,4-benzoquinol methylase
MFRRDYRRVCLAPPGKVRANRDDVVNEVVVTAPARLLKASALSVQGRSAEIADNIAVRAGRALARAGTTLLLYPHRAAHIDVPAKVEIADLSLDVVADLVEYTGLGREQVEALIQRRHESFRTEWHAFPVSVRNDAWFYLSSRTYLFGNASHEAHAVAERLTDLMPSSSDVLDFGGGAGNLALALAARGHSVDYLERSALQKDFVRFRVERHGLHESVRVLDQWRPLPSAAYDLVCAFDVFEHIEALSETLASLLATLRPSGMLAESSPFIRNVSNPMHHESEAEFARLVHEEGFALAYEGEDFRIWTSSR